MTDLETMARALDAYVAKTQPDSLAPTWRWVVGAIGPNGILRDQRDLYEADLREKYAAIQAAG